MSKTKLIGWDNLSFQVPYNWDPDALGPGYLRLSDGNRPLVEMKWQQNVGDVTAKNHFSKLTSKLKSQSGLEVQKMVLPAAWKSAVKKFECTAFFWRSDTVAGRGAVIFHQKTKSALLIQFFEQNSSAHPDADEIILSSLQFCRKDQAADWAVFDIRLKAPKAQLGKHSFKPGLFELELIYPRHKLDISRLGPAKAILSGQSLEDLAKENFSAMFPNNSEPARTEFKGFEALIWDRPWPDNVVAKVQKALTKQHGARRLLLWHDIENERILSVLYSGQDAPDTDDFTAVCESYEIVR